MIKLVLPLADEIIYCALAGGIVGPIRPGGAPVNSEPIEFRSTLDWLSQVKGYYHENNVDHQQATGTVRYSPVSLGITPSPTLDLPDRVVWDAYTYPNKSRNTVYAKDGLVGEKTASYSRDAFYAYNVAWYMPTPYLITRYEATCLRSRPSFVTTLTKIVYTYRSYASGIAYWEYASTSYKLPPTGLPTGDFSVKKTYEEIVHLVGGLSSTVGSPVQIGVQAYTSNVVYSASPITVRAGIDARMAVNLNLGVFPIEPQHFGELAFKASEKLNANSVNMIAFLKDLRRPQELIPKLKNLKRLKLLKGLSDNYLTVKYGILPTIDDLKSIVESFKKIKPYIDKNGFSTYSAGFTDSKVIGDITFKLEQHIKLAIADEDSAFYDFIERMESTGFAPNFENLWDLVPYSFVIDWFVDFGDFLERIDTRLRLARLPIRYVTSSIKRTATWELKPTLEFPYVGSIELAHYQRWVSDQCPAPPLFLETTFQDFSHWLEAGALLIQRTK